VAVTGGSPLFTLTHDYEVLSSADDMPRTGSSPVARAIREAVGVLSAGGVASPRVDAELLAAHVLGVPRSRLAQARPLTAPERERLRALVVARADRVPLQHLTGLAPFRHLELSVGPGVFVPRPETELLVDWGLAAVGGLSAPVVVDLCAGTGAIALAVAQECPHATVYAVEREPAALEWLRRNASGTRVSIVDGDATAATTLSTLDGAVDLVLSNPPYVPSGAPVDPEVRDHDPATAVFGGPDGLDVIRPLVTRVAALLRSGGWFGVEHDEGQASSVPTLMKRDGRYGDIADHADLGGRPRFATARRLAD
jgi:release factor glutamine methyltransferase